MVHALSSHYFYLPAARDVRYSQLYVFTYKNGYDVRVFGGLSLLILIIIIIGYKEFKLVSFDVAFAKCIGYPVKRIEFILALLMVMTITAGIQAVGVVLMASMLIIPAAAARYWTDSLRVMLIIAAGTGALSGITGSFISFTAPAMPTGPWMVVSAALIFLLSFLLAPGRGEIAAYIKKKKLSDKIVCENILKSLYSMEEEDGREDRVRPFHELHKRRNITTGRLKKVIHTLRKKGWINSFAGNPESYVLTTDGRKEAKRLVRAHRLWEQYLTQHLQIAEDHVHDDAESMEHLITDEIELQLRQSLGSPAQDPHKSNIPYDDIVDDHPKINTGLSPVHKTSRKLGKKDNSGHKDDSNGGKRS